MNVEFDRDLLLRCHRKEQLQREMEVHRRRSALIPDPRSVPRRSRWRRR